MRLAEKVIGVFEEKFKLGKTDQAVLDYIKNWPSMPLTLFKEEIETLRKSNWPIRVKNQRASA